MNAYGYLDKNTMITVENLAINLGRLAEKRVEQLRTGYGDDAALVEQIMDGLDEAIELFRTVNECSYRYVFPTYSLAYFLTHSLTHSLTYSFNCAVTSHHFLCHLTSIYETFFVVNTQSNEAASSFVILYFIFIVNYY